MESRMVHRTLAPIIGSILCIMAVTGACRCIMTQWLGLDKSLTKGFMRFHKMNFFGLGIILLPLIAVTSMVFICTGSTLNSAWRAKQCPAVKDLIAVQDTRAFHSIYTLVACAPLMITVVTGGVHVICRKWIGLEKDQARWLLRLHTMDMFHLGAIYPILVALLVITMATSGFGLLPCV
eukprot:Ihof_evm2s521 gene=Ihof_evmTU2s521